jgi:choline dehydrogenase-like flavoprotein
MLPGPALAAALRASTLDAVLAGPHDALVIGAGATGGLAALLLAEGGLRVLLLDAGPARSPLRSLSRRLIRGTIRRLLGRAAVDAFGRRRQSVQSCCYAWGLAPEAFVDDIDCPYLTPSDRPFVWLRSRQLGGRMVVPSHGRQYYRLGPCDLNSSWPLPYTELGPWYALVERRIGVAGTRDDLPWLPDSELSSTLSPTATEAALQQSIKTRWPNARPVLARFASPFDALEAAARTGRLLIRRGAIVREIEVDGSGHVCGAVWIDHRIRSEERVRAPLVFLCASALESTRLLLLSRSPQSPDGLGASSGALGRYLMDHVRLRAEGEGPRLVTGPPQEGRCLYLPRFDARELSVPSDRPGFGVQVYQTPTERGGSKFRAACFAEMLPQPGNRVMLDPKRRDAWGIPVLYIDCSYGPEEMARAREQIAALRALAEVANVTLTHIDEVPAPPGSCNHECGTARMGRDPASSVLDPHNECWEAQGLYVTDGACLPSQGTQNPTLTLLALTARACNHALRERGGHSSKMASANSTIPALA